MIRPVRLRTLVASRLLEGGPDDACSSDAAQQHLQLPLQVSFSTPAFAEFTMPHYHLPQRVFQINCDVETCIVTAQASALWLGGEGGGWRRGLLAGHVCGPGARWALPIRTHPPSDPLPTRVPR